jgi:PAS domain S-box-containing protein
MAGLLLLALTAPGRGQTPTGEPLIVRGDHNYPPYEYIQKGQPTGFNVELMQAVCEAVRLPVRIELGPWREVRAQLEAGRIDALGGMAFSEERAQLVEFCTPHTMLAFDLFVPVGSSIRSLDDVRGRALAVQEGGRMHDLARELQLTPHLTTRPDVPQIIRDLSAGRYEAALLNRAQTLFFLDHMRITNVIGARIDIDPVAYGFAVATGRTDLAQRLNEGLNIVKATGQYRALYDKWLGVYERPPARLTTRQVAWLAALVLVLFATSLIWSWSLRRLVRRRTSELRQVIDLVPHRIFAKDSEGRFLLVNRACAEALGLDIRSIVGRRHHDLDPGHVQDVLRQLKDDRAVLEGGHPTYVEERLHNARGEQRTLQTTRVPFRSSLSPLPAVLGVSVDITDLKRAEAALRASEDNLTITLHSIGEAVLATDAQGRVRRMNPVAESLTGWNFGEAQDRRLADILTLQHPDTHAPLENPVERILQGRSGSGVAQQAVLVARHGTERTITATGAPMRDREGQIVGAVMIFRDETEEQRVEDRLREAEKMETVGRLAGGIAHDFNNILGGIMGFAELIALKETEIEEARAHARSILNASERARDMIQKLLAYSRRSPRRLLPVHLHQLLQDVTGLLRHTLDKRIEIRLQLDCARPYVQGDPTQLQSVFMNLAVNARDAMPRGGTLTLSTYETVLKEDFCLQHGGRLQAGPHVVVAVADTGVGMDQKVLDHLFEPFFTTKEAGAGTGLGLAAVHGTINDHGGLVTVESEPGRGTVFRIYLPPADPANLPEEPVAPAPRMGSGTILLVDDEEVILHTTGRMLGDLGYEVLVARGGHAALHLMKERPRTSTWSSSTWSCPAWMARTRSRPCAPCGRISASSCPPASCADTTRRT